LEVRVADSAPEILGVAHADGAPVTIERPAASGEILVVYVTGLGQVNSAPALGSLASSSTLATMSEAPDLTIGDNPAHVLFAGLTPGAVGLYQINVVVPENTSGSNAQLVISTTDGDTSTDLPTS
jgi:uncharacterized protein (TIGR03437 family)